MKNKIIVSPEGGQPFEAELIMAFEMIETGNKYVIYTLNEKLSNDLIKLYVAGVTNENGQDVAKAISSEEEWNQIKEIMKEIISGGNS